MTKNGKRMIDGRIIYGWWRRSTLMMLDVDIDIDILLMKSTIDFSMPVAKSSRFAHRGNQ